MEPKLTHVVGTVVLLASCSGFAEYTECRDGEVQACTSPCGPGTQTCEANAWGPCQPDATPECLPGDSGTCTLSPDEPPGLWLCSDTCRVGPCIRLCVPGDTADCETNCGPGQVTCQDDGSWSECVEYIIPPCRSGDVAICRGEDGPGYWRCTEECDWGPCDASLACFPGERVECGLCATQECGPDGTWGECQARTGAACTPGEGQECPGPCGTGFQICSETCEWSECLGFGGCTPGSRQVCPSSYCGVAFRICGPDCVWTDCIEAGF